MEELKVPTTGSSRLLVLTVVFSALGGFLFGFDVSACKLDHANRWI